MENTSWEKAADWYGEIASKKGHYYHQKVIFPKLLQLLRLKQTKNPAILDLGCGPGAFASKISSSAAYYGVDLSPSLIKKAEESDLENARFFCGDVMSQLPFQKKDFSHALFILSLQNISDPLAAFQVAREYLRRHGKLILVINHPCFRIPRQSSWQIDEDHKLQYRRMNLYMSPQKIPILTHPGKNKQKKLYSYHFPLSDYFKFLKQTKFAILDLQEWCSDKQSVGKKAKMENRARQEFPLFLMVTARKE